MSSVTGTIDGAGLRRASKRLFLRVLEVFRLMCCDVIGQCSSLDELLTIYRVQFPVPDSRNVEIKAKVAAR